MKHEFNLTGQPVGNDAGDEYDSDQLLNLNPS